jgi:exopolysaccharide biosynthesis protein
MTWGPFLVVNGESANLRGNGGWGYANRTAIAQRQDGIVLFVVIDGRGSNGSRGASMRDLVELFERYGAYNAANLDGGGSSAMTLHGNLLNEPRSFGHVGERFLPNAWILK